MTLKEQVEQDLGLPVGEPTAKAYSVTYEPYVTMHVGGSMSDDDAIVAFRSAVVGYCQQQTKGRPGYQLYWRKEPELKKSDFTEIYCRLLISNKAVEEQAA